MKHFALLLFMFYVAGLHAQTYPKYKTKKVMDTIFVNEAKVVEDAYDGK